MIDFEKDQQEVIKKTDNIQSLADQVERLEQLQKIFGDKIIPQHSDKIDLEKPLIIDLLDQYLDLKNFIKFCNAWYRLARKS